MVHKRDLKKGRINYHIYNSSITHESRIFKETQTIAQTGLFKKIFIFGIQESGLDPREKLDEIRFIQRIPFHFRYSKKKDDINLGIISILSHIFWGVRIFFLGLRDKPVLCNAHSLRTLWIGWLLKIFLNNILIYDTHELETEVAYLENHRLLKKFYQFFEKLLIHKVDLIVVVTSGIEKWYKDEYGNVSVITVRNIPDVQVQFDVSRVTIRSLLKLNDEDLLFIYIGGLYPSRGISIILETFAQVDKYKHIAFMGYGPYSELIHNYSEKCSNIHFIEPVHPNQVLSMIKDADVGICLIENTCNSYYLSLPNKLFEYYFVKIPSITSNFPSMNEFVQKHRSGWVIEPNLFDFHTLVDTLNAKDISEKKKTINGDSNLLWDREVTTYLAFIFHHL